MSPSSPELSPSAVSHHRPPPTPRTLNFLRSSCSVLNPSHSMMHVWGFFFSQKHSSAFIVSSVWKQLLDIFFPVFCIQWEDKSGLCWSFMTGSRSLDLCLLSPDVLPLFAYVNRMDCKWHAIRRPQLCQSGSLSAPSHWHSADCGRGRIDTGSESGDNGDSSLSMWILRDQGKHFPSFLLHELGNQDGQRRLLS